eukprot:Rmarinus@m.29701
MYSNPHTINHLPSDVLGEIFSRLPCENTLLGAVAKVNREWREIALHPSTRKRVQDCFISVHVEECFNCRHIAVEGPAHRDLCVPVAEGWLNCVRFLFLTTSAEPFISAADDNGWTVLHYAAEHGHLDMVQYFMGELGRSVAAELVARTDDGGETVLHHAAHRGRLDVIRYFVEKEGLASLLYAIDFCGKTVLHHAGWKGHVDVVRYVIEERGATDLIKRKCQEGRTV